MNANSSYEFPSGNISIGSHDLLVSLPITEGKTNSLLAQNPGYLPFS